MGRTCLAVARDHEADLGAGGEPGVPGGQGGGAEPASS